MNEAARRYCLFLEQLDVRSLDRLPDYVRADVRFKDPFNDVTGIEAMQAVFADLFKHLDDVVFTVRACMPDGPKALIAWTLSGTLEGGPWTVDGASELRFDADGLLAEHIDHWDAASGLYERFPVIGALLRFLRRRLRSRP